jgi:ribosomal protein S6--L-glutamate ligase
MVPHANRTLRVVVIGQTVISYWRIQDKTDIFGTSLSSGARIDHEVDPLIRDHAESLTRQFCRKTHINLAGLDFIINASDLTRDDPQALMLEINYYFGRTGLGGSIPFYGLLQAEIDNWLASLRLGIRTSLSSTPSPETS